MIGNDIIDLNSAGINSRWQEQRFLDKLFSEQEKDFILLDGTWFQNIWRLWSMKESAYKIYARETESLRYNPKYFSCHIISETNGIVTFDNYTVNTTTKYDSHSIYTTAYLKNTELISDNFVLDGISQSEKSQLLREKAIAAFAEVKSVSRTAILIDKNDFGIPQFLVNRKVQNNALTLTHHGQYGGFAISY